MNTQFRSLVATFTASALINLCNAVLFTVLPIYLVAASGEQEGTALIAAGYYAGFLLGCIYGPRAIYNTGYIRAFAAGGSCLAIAILAFSWFINAPSWIGLRFLTGIAIGVMLTATDSWINVGTEGRNRGVVLALYGALLSVAAIASQFLVYAFDTRRLMLGGVLCAIVNIAVLLLTTTRAAPPKPLSLGALGPVSYAREHPTAFFGCFVCGMLSASAFNIMPHYLSQNGIGAMLIAVCISSLYIGRLVLQWPIGKISDRVDRRYVLVAVSVISGLLATLFWLFGSGEGRIIAGASGEFMQWIAIAGLGLWGAFTLPIYSLSVAHALDHTDSEKIVGLTSLSLLVYAAGGILGPIVCAGLTYVFCDRFLPAGIAMMAFGYGVLILSRILVLPVNEPQNAVNFAEAPTTSVAVSEIVADAEEQVAEDELVSDAR